MFTRLLRISLLVLMVVVAFSFQAGAQEGDAGWQGWSDVPVESISDDNSGSSIAESEAVTTPDGAATLELTPNGTSEETKMVVPFSGEALQDWRGAGQIALDVYIPPENELIPNRFFMGMADVTGEFLWVGGIFGEAEGELTEGWNRIIYTPDPNMLDPKAESQYNLFLSFFYADENENKTPLTEPIYLGGMTLLEGSGEAPAEAVREPEFDAEAEALLALDNEALLDAVAQATFDYFWNETNPNNGLIKDRSTDDSPSSIAAVGFGLSAIPIGIERGWISEDEGYERALLTLQTFADGFVPGEFGFFYHFINMETGERAFSSEVSTIDTTLLIAGALTAGEYFSGTEVETLARQLYEGIEWDAMLEGDDMVSMGWKPDSEFLDAQWSGFDEGLLLYVLAIGSPTHPVAPEAWDQLLRPVNTEGEYIYIGAEPLFVYQYPLAWLDLRELEDEYANYANNTARACERNRQFSRARADEYATYQNGVWGISASDGPSGYRAYGAAEGNHDGTIAPYASIACLPFTPELAFESMRAMLREYGSLVWDEYGFVSAINEDVGWYSEEHIGIDQGDILLMIDNYQDGMIWDLFMQNDYVQAGLERIGFSERPVYAVNPDYLAEAREAEAASRAPLTASEGEVVVDGALDDWDGATFNTVESEMLVPLGGGETAPEGVSSRFALQYDETTLYVAAEVTDPVIVSNIAPDDLEAFYRTDSVEFYIDPATDDAEIYKLAIIPFDTEGNVQAIRHEDSNPGPISETAPEIEVASSETDDGYIVEVAIPLALLGVDGAAGTELHFSHLVHNSSAENAEVGAYVRENVIGWNPVANVWQTPSNWSVVTFE